MTHPVPAAERTLHLLELLLENPAGLPTRHILSRLDLSRSSLFALLRTLIDLDYAEPGPTRGYYRPGPRLLAWRRLSPAGPLDLIRGFHTEAQSLALDETLALLLPVTGGLLVLAQHESPHHVRAAWQPNSVIPFAASAAGPLFDHPPLPSVRELAYSLHSSHGAIQLALPICADGFHPEAAFLLAAPAFRSSPADLLVFLPALRQAAAHLSYRLGARLYAPFQSPTSPSAAPVAPMTPAEISAFLQGPWAARLASLNPDGSPHVIPVWHEWDGHGFYVIAWDGSRWGDNLIANPSVSLTIDEPWLPLRRVTVQGIARPRTPPQSPFSLPQLMERLSRRYLGIPAAPAMLNRSGVIFYITPQTLTGRRGLETPA